MKFPAWYSFHLNRDLNTGELGISATDERTKADANNRKFSHLKRYSWDGKMQFSLIEIKQIHSEDELKERFLHLHKVWIDPVPELINS